MALESVWTFEEIISEIIIKLFGVIEWSSDYWQHFSAEVITSGRQPEHIEHDKGLSLNYAWELLEGEFGS